MQSAEIGDNESACFETAVDGNAVSQISFYWKTDSEAGGDFLKLYVNGAVIREISGDTSWTQVEFTLGPARLNPLTNLRADHVLKWCYEKNASGASGQDRAWLDQFSLSAPSASLVDTQTALGLANAPILSGDAEWFGLQETTLLMLSASYAESGLLGHNQSACLTRSLSVTNAPAKLEFEWSVSSEENADYLKFYVDSDANDGTENYLEVRSISGDVDEEVEYVLGANAVYSLRWCYEKNASGEGGLDRARLKAEVNLLGSSVESFPSLNAISTVAETEALDLPASPPLSLTNPAPRPSDSAPTTAWFGQTETTNDGDDALQSASLLHEQSSCFEIPVTGIAELRFYWKVDSQENSDHLRFYVDNTQRAEISGNVDWRQYRRFFTGSASRSLKWCYEKDVSGASGADHGWIDQLEIFYFPTPEEALDLPSGQTVTLTRDDDLLESANWFGQRGVSSDGTDALESGAIPDDKSTCFRTEVNGPVTVSFYWKVSSEDGYDELKFYVDSTLGNDISGELDWREVIHNLSDSREYVLRWCYNKDGYGSDGEDTGWVDRLSFQAITPPTPPDTTAFSEALDLVPEQSFSSSGDFAWISQTDRSYEGMDALQSGAITHLGTSCFETSVNGPVTLSFYWKVSSESLYDELKFYVDNTIEEKINGDVDWRELLHNLPNNREYDLKWCYEKDDSVSNGEDKAWVDRLRLLPFSLPPSPSQALDLEGSGQSFNFSGDAEWISQTTESSDGIDALQSGTIGDYETSCFETNVNGPVAVSFYWKVSSDQYGDDVLKFYVDDSRRDEIKGEIDWSQESYNFFLSQSYALRWCYEKDSVPFTEGFDKGWVDRLRITPVTPVDTQNALDHDERSFSFSGNRDWFGQTQRHQDGVDALQSGEIGRGQRSCFETNIEGEAEVNFYVKLSSRQGYFSFSVDDVEVLRLEGEKDWREIERFVAGNGSHELEWCYRKGNSDDANDANLGFLNAAWIDQLRILPQQTISPAQALDFDTAGIADQNVTFSGAPWFGQSNTSYDGSDAFQSGLGAGSQRSCFETIANDPILVDFQWKVFSQEGQGLLSFYVNDQGQEEITGDTDWQATSYALEGSGERRLKWCYNGRDGDPGEADGGWVDQLRIRPFTPISPALALDSNLSLSFSGDAEWFGQPQESNDGIDALQSGSIGDGEESCFASAVTGPAVLAFHWKFSSYPFLGNLRFSIDGVEKARLNGGFVANWEEQRHILEQGREYDLQWCHNKNYVGRIFGWAWVDRVELSYFASLDEAEALDLVGIGDGSNAVTGSGEANWFGQTEESNDGIDALQSGSIGDDQTSCFEIKATGPNNIAFYWKVSSESNDSLHFYTDNILRKRISGEIDWEEHSYLLEGSGEHTLKWCYEKNASGARGLDRGWVDGLRITPFSSLSFAEALDITGYSFSSSGEANWFGQDLITNDDSDALQSGAIAINQSSCFSTTVDVDANEILMMDFSWKIDAQNQNRMAFYVNDSLDSSINGNRDWASASKILETMGQHTLKWCYEKNAEAQADPDRAWLDQLRLTLLNTSSVQTADLQGGLDNSALSFSQEAGSGNWFLQTSHSSDGSDALRSPGGLAVGQSSCFTATVPAETTDRYLSFHWRKFSGSSGNVLTFHINGNYRTSMEDGGTSWSQSLQFLEGGREHNLRWCYRRMNYSNSLGFGLVDQVRIETALDPALALDLDPSQILRFSGSGGWFGQNAIHNDGTDALQSQYIGDYQSACVETDINLNGPWDLSFYWRISSDFGDRFRFYVNGESLDRITGLRDWRRYSRSFPNPGIYALRWCYEKDDEDSYREDRAWLDQIEITPR